MHKYRNMSDDDIRYDFLFARRTYVINTMIYIHSRLVHIVYGRLNWLETGLYIDILNKDCRRSISAILTWVRENVKISARPLNSIGN